MFVEGEKEDLCSSSEALINRACRYLGTPQSPEGGAPGFGSRMFDSDGDGRMDLFLLDFDNDGTVDKVVRGSRFKWRRGQRYIHKL